MSNEKYIILKNQSTDKLTSLVNEKIKEGYVIQGGVSSYDSVLEGNILIQAMIKEEDNAT